MAIGEISNPFSSGNSSSTNSAMSIDDVATALDKGSEKEPEDKSEKKTKTPPAELVSDEPEDEIDKDDESEEEPKIDEDEETEDSEDELKTIELEDEVDYSDTPRRKDILKDYPDLFKKYPQLEKAMYRAHEFSEVFPSISDAKQAKEELSVLNQFRGELLEGNVGNILKSVKDENPKAFSKIADEFMVTLGQIDPAAQVDVFNQITKTLINQAYQAGKTTKNQQLEWAAQHLHNFFYNSPEVGQYQRVNQNRVNPEEQKLAAERSSFERSKLTSAVNDITTRIDNTLKATVEKHIDPNGLMTPYIKRNAVSEAVDQLRSAIGSDKRLQTVITKLYENARNEDYSDSSKSKIRSVILKKAQAILSDTIKKVQADALKGLSSRKREASESKDEKPLPRGRTASPRNNSSNKQDALTKTKGMSTADALNALMGDS